MQRRNVLRILGGGVVLAAGLGAGWASLPTSMPSAATVPWAGPDEATRSGNDIRRVLLSYALLAPHAHNLQSWSADLSQTDAIVLYCDLERLLPQTDPYSRQILISHGAFLEVLELAARAHGLRADITLFPKGAFDPRTLDKRPVAMVHLQKDASAVGDALFDQVLHRHTNRATYDLARPVPAAALAAMRAAAGQAVTLGFASASDGPLFTELGGIAREAWRVELVTPRTVLESMQLLRVGTKEVARNPDGIALLDPLPVALDRLGLLGRDTPPAGASLDQQINGFNDKIASTPGMLWLTTQANDRPAQIAAGRAYVRAQLAATAQGLSFHPLSQALQEYPEQAALHDKVHAITGARQVGATVQMWVRVGYAPPTGPSPRRGLQALVRT